MKYVIVPPDVTIMNKATGKPVRAIDGDTEKDFVVSMQFFVERYISTSSKLLRFRPDEASGEGLRRVAKLLRVFEGGKPGDVIGIEDADYKAARAAVDALDWSALGLAGVAPQLLPMVEAWEAAEKQDDEWKRKRDEATVPAKHLTVVEGEPLRAG